MCTNATCENETKVRRQLTLSRTPEEIEYGKLWAEIELPKLLKEMKNNEQNRI
jgi:hypothetical protein